MHSPTRVAAATSLHPEERPPTNLISPLDSGAEYSESKSQKKKGDLIDSRLQRKWSRWLNPLRLQKIPPVPEERSVCPEYGAGIFSIISFQWIASLMHVSFHSLQ